MQSFYNDAMDKKNHASVVPTIMSRIFGFANI
ncbi:hypothetical protein ABIE66_004463 [Peribacillus sp. B2I2]